MEEAKSYSMINYEMGEGLVENVIVSWSGGKDSAYALYSLLQERKYNVKGLFSTTTMEILPAHEVSSSLIREQARSIQLPFYELELPSNPSNAVYEELVGKQLEEFKKMGIETIVYADLLLEDMKAYRDNLLKQHGMKGLYPLWKKDTLLAVEDFIIHGFKAIITTVEDGKISKDRLGNIVDQTFIQSLPGQVDPSGEYGEYHTYVCDGPIFTYPIEVRVGEIFETQSFGNRYIHVKLNKKTDE